MDPDNRDTILKNMSILEGEFKYKELSDLCLQQDGLYFEVMRSKIERMHTSDIQRLRALLEKLTKRGPTAFDVLLKICDEQFPDAARILRKSEISLRNNRPRKTDQATKRPSGSGTTNETLVEYDQVLTQPTYFTEVIKSTRFPEPGVIKCYNMRSRHRGVAFLVNIIQFKRNSHRNGAEKDRENLVALWQQMGFVVYYYEDITKDQFFNLLKQLADSDQLEKAECLVITLMTHGSLMSHTETVEFTDSESESVEKIVEQFSNKMCPNMLHKPKVFFFPFCRTNNDNDKEMAANHMEFKSSGTSQDGSMNAAPVETPVSPYSLKNSDMKICYATSKGFAALRDANIGSWYIHALCKVFADHAHDKHLNDLLILIGEMVRQQISPEGYIQTANNKDIGLFAHLFFNPGLYE